MHAVGNREEVSGTGSVPQIKDGSTALVHLLVGNFLGFGKGLLFCSMWGTSAIVKSPSRIFIKVHVCVLDNIHVWLNIVC